MLTIPMHHAAIQITMPLISMHHVKTRTTMSIHYMQALLQTLRPPAEELPGQNTVATELNWNYDPDCCDHKPPREWDARDIQGVLNQQGIEPQPGPNDTTSSEEDLIAITSRNIHGLNSHLSAAIRGRDPIICLQEADLAESNVFDIRAQAQTAGSDILTSACEWGRRATILAANC